MKVYVVLDYAEQCSFVGVFQTWADASNWIGRNNRYTIKVCEVGKSYEGDSSPSDTYAGGPCVETDFICASEETAKSRVKFLENQWFDDYGYDANVDMFTYEPREVIK